MLIEDDPNLCQSITLILQRAGYLVVATDSVPIAVNMIENGHYNLVLADLNIPGVDVSLIPIVLKSQPALAVVILTDHPATEAEKEDKLRGVHYLFTPVAPERMLDFVQMTLNVNGHSNSSKQLIYQ
jgi:DNA-binding NtrC family response regulator